MQVYPAAPTGAPRAFAPTASSVASRFKPTRNGVHQRGSDMTAQPSPAPLDGDDAG